MGLQLFLLLCLLGVVMFGISGLLLAGAAGLAVWTFRKAFRSWRELIAAESLLHPVTRQKKCRACGEVVHEHARICCFCGATFEAERTE